MNDSTRIQKIIITIQIFVIISLTVMIFKQGGLPISKDDGENNEGNTAWSLSENNSSEGLDNDFEEDEYDDGSSGDYSAIVAVEDNVSSDSVDALQNSEEIMGDEESGKEIQDLDSREDEETNETSEEEPETVLKNEIEENAGSGWTFENNKNVMKNKGVVEKTLEYISNMIEPWLEPASDEQKDDNTDEDNAASELSNDYRGDEDGREGQDDTEDGEESEEWDDKAGEKEDEYILFDSDRRYYTKEEIGMLDDWTLQMAINELYARHGRKFVLESVREYFEEKSWYEGLIEPKDFDGHEREFFNDYEEENRKIMVEIRDAREAEKKSAEGTKKN